MVKTPFVEKKGIKRALQKGIQLYKFRLCFLTMRHAVLVTFRQYQCDKSVWPKKSHFTNLNRHPGTFCHCCIVISYKAEAV